MGVLVVLLVILAGLLLVNLLVPPPFSLRVSVRCFTAPRRPKSSLRLS